MEMRNEIDAVEAYVEEAVSAAPMRPTRPNRPDGAKRSARPMMLNNPIESPRAAPAEGDAPVKMERPARPVRAEGAEGPARDETLARPERPKTERRARVLEPDQVAASRGEEYNPPSSEARDAMLGADEDVAATSKVGAVVQSFGQIFAGLKKSKAEVSEAVDAVEAAVEVKAVEAHEPETVEAVIADVVAVADDQAEEMVADADAPKTSKFGGVMAKMSALPMALKKKKSEPIVVDVAPETVMPADVIAQKYEIDAMEEIAEVDPAFIPAKPSMMARFDTPLMGVLAAIFVSSIGLVGVSVLFG